MWNPKSSRGFRTARHLSEWGDRASGFASDELSVGEEVRVEVDSSADREDRNDRLLVYLYHDDGELFNRQLLDQGYARLYDTEFSKRGEFADLEEQAQSNDVGLWDSDNDGWCRASAEGR